MSVKVKEDNRMPIEQDYYERYTALCSEAWRGWHAVNIMNCLIDLQNDKESVTNDNRNPIINYLLDAATRDAVLTLWKVYYDDDAKADRIDKLNTAMRTDWGFNRDVKLSFSSKAKTDKSQINNIRNQYLAHRDKQGFNFRFILDPLLPAYEELIVMLNGLCAPEIDERVKPITDEKKTSLQTSIKSGLEIITKGLYKDKEINRRTPKEIVDMKRRYQENRKKFSGKKKDDNH